MFFCMGLSHKTTEIAIREKLHIRPADLPDALQRFRRETGIHHAVILSTCNRFEVYAGAETPAVAEWIFQHGGGADEIRQRLIPKTNRAAVEHLFAVAGGLDAQVLGETQILGQVRDAYIAAQSAGMTDGPLNTLFQRALGIGKRIRSETRLAETPVSVGSIAIRLCEKIFVSLRGRTAAVIGAGEISALVAHQLAERGARITIYATRRRETAEELARAVAAQFRPVEDLSKGLAEAEIVISASGSPHVLISADQIAQAQMARGGHPLFLVDLSVPRTIAAEVAKLENVFIYNIDDLEAIANEHRSERAREIPKCEKMIQDEALDFWTGSFGAGEEDALRRFHSRISEVVEQELRRGGIDGAALDTLKKSIPNKILSEAFRKSRIQSPDRQTFMQALKEFFGL